MGVQEKDVTEFIFKRFNALTEPNATAQQREGILYRVFSVLSKCDKQWQCQLDILDVFSNILKNKPEILFGCSNLLDLILDFIETLQNENSKNEKTEIAIISKLCHLISIVGCSQLNVCALTRILSLLRSSLLNKNRRSLAPLLLSTLKEMVSVSPPFYDNHQQNHLSHSSSNNSPKHVSSSKSNHKKNKKNGKAQSSQNTNNDSWIPSPQKIISNKIF